MFTIYVYVLETLADWKLGYVTSELHSGRFFKKDAESVSLKTVSDSKEPIHTMGGLTVLPDCLVDDVVVSETSVLLAYVVYLTASIATAYYYKRLLFWAKQKITQALAERKAQRR